MDKHKQEQVLKETKRQILLCDLTLGKVLINKTDGIVYLKDGEQIKIGMGKSRKGRDYNFSRPHFWRVATWFETFRVKSGLYRLWKVRF